METSYTRIETLLRRSPPALLRIATSDAALQSAGGLFLALLGSRGERLRLLGPDGKTHWVAVEAVRLRLCGDWEAPLLAGIDALLDEANG